MRLDLWIGRAELETASNGTPNLIGVPCGVAAIFHRKNLPMLVANSASLISALRLLFGNILRWPVGMLTASSVTSVFAYTWMRKFTGAKQG